MRGWKFLSIAVFLVLVIATASACSSSSSGIQQQQVAVTKGDLIIKVNGSGKVVVDIDAEPYFPGGKVSQLFVKEGDPVSKGMVLAKLETDALELALSQAQVGLAQAQVGLTQVQSAQTQAEIALAAAQFNLDRTKAVSDIMDEITQAQMDVAIAQALDDEAHIYSNSDRLSFWGPRILELKITLAEKQQKLVDLLSKEEFTGEFLYLQGQKYDRLAVEDARIKQLQVTSAQLSVQQALQNIEQARKTSDQAAKAVALAQKQLNDATITSPINGTAITINAKEGEIALSPSVSVPMYLADLSTLRVNAQIDEIDIASVKIGQKVNLKLDSAPDTLYEGKVISVSLAPVANPQNSGVVVYEVEIGFATPPPTEVKLGMSATVDIISIERLGALIVPSRAVKTDTQGKTVIDVMVNQKIETRQIQTGVSDGINTELISGLNTGDIVIVTRAASPSGMFGQ
jgi:HlyD family secretion protein